MTEVRGPFRVAVFLLGLGAVLHLAAFVAAGFSPWGLVGLGLIFAACAAGLAQGWRWLGYLVFCALFLVIAWTLGRFWAPGPLGQPWVLGLIGVDALAVLALFSALWRGPAAE